MSTEKKMLYLMEASILLLIIIYVAAVTFCNLTPEQRKYAENISSFFFGVMTTLVTFSWGASKKEENGEHPITIQPVTLPQPKKENIENVQS